MFRLEISCKLFIPAANEIGRISLLFISVLTELVRWGKPLNRECAVLGHEQKYYFQEQIFCGVGSRMCQSVKFSS